VLVVRQQAEYGGRTSMIGRMKGWIEASRRPGSPVVVALLWLAACSAPPPTVERITIVNTTGYDFDVEVAGPERGGWLPVAIAEAGSENVAEAVIDQGEVWVFRFLHWGDPVGELSLTRAELVSGGWQVEVPEELEGRLRLLGRPPSI
jgi:hypothetical protein